MFPLNNLTKVSTGSFSEVYFYFGRSWWSWKDRDFVLVP